MPDCNTLRSDVLKRLPWACYGTQPIPTSFPTPIMDCKPSVHSDGVFVATCSNGQQHKGNVRHAQSNEAPRCAEADAQIRRGEPKYALIGCECRYNCSSSVLWDV
eukprot:scaffold28206_cov16-Tisochrysis_lutea.AAC.1